MNEPSQTLVIPSRKASASEWVLRVEDLHSEFKSDQGVVRAVDGVSFDVGRGEVVGLVGESGCGKSATCMSVMRLLPAPHGYIRSGSIQLRDKQGDATLDLAQLQEKQMQRVRGNRIAMIFQDPMTSLNPYLTVDEQLSEVGELHLGKTRAQARADAVKLLDRVGLPDAERQVKSYPHELSGGMRQRVMIAMALLCDPELLIADEPTTALDVTTQAQILELLLELRAERGLSVILITHDLGVVSETCDRVMVMYAGRIVETAPAAALFEAPQHPYTVDLLRSVPRVDNRADKLFSIAGLPPRLDQGEFRQCTYLPRCQRAVDACQGAEPPLTGTEPGRARRCVLPIAELK